LKKVGIHQSAGRIFVHGKGPNIPTNQHDIFWHFSMSRCGAGKSSPFLKDSTSKRSGDCPANRTHKSLQKWNFSTTDPTAVVCRAQEGVAASI